MAVALQLFVALHMDLNMALALHMDLNIGGSHGLAPHMVG